MAGIILQSFLNNCFFLALKKYFILNLNFFNERFLKKVGYFDFFITYFTQNDTMLKRKGVICKFSKIKSLRL